ncbi:unnamed protein product, partial [marine sediment metagenome]
MSENRIKNILEEIEGLITEIADPRFSRLDRISVEEILKIINDEDSKVADTVKDEIT